MGWHSTQETRVHDAFDDVTSTVHLSLFDGVLTMSARQVVKESQEQHSWQGFSNRPLFSSA
jgi:hypothetical protein